MVLIEGEKPNQYSLLRIESLADQDIRELY